MKVGLVKTAAIATMTAILATCGGATLAADTPTAKQLERGRYMAITGGCNDCHTAGFGPNEGKIPEQDWLLGSGPLGFNGPWGTTYASNLRLLIAGMSENDWVKLAKTLKTRPPMPWFNVNKWREGDMRAFYQYAKSLGAAGQPALAYLPPDKAPNPPFVQWPSPPKQ